MNLSALTDKEVLRMCAPESDLEKRLLNIAIDLQDNLDFANMPSEPEYEDDYCSDCESKINEIDGAISLIEDGKVSDGVAKLRRID